MGNTDFAYCPLFLFLFVFGAIFVSIDETNRNVAFEKLSFRKNHLVRMCQWVQKVILGFVVSLLFFIFAFGNIVFSSENFRIALVCL